MNKKATIGILILILVAGIGLFFAYRNNDIVDLPPSTTGTTLAGLGESWSTSSQKSSGSSSSKASGSNAAPTTAKSSGSYAYAGEYGFSPSTAPISSGNPYLICVNRSYALPTGYSTAVKTEVCVSAYPEKLKMAIVAAEKYREMYNDAKQADVELIPYSAYRSTSHQKNNFDRRIQSHINKGLSRTDAINKTLEYIQLPGCSEHETGLAIDITRPGVWDTDPNFDKTDEFKWLQANAHKYGFILRYPADKVDVTKINYEPWHWRYVGAEDAAKMKNSGKCLEEYTGFNA